jgi:hypothetical protein
MVAVTPPEYFATTQLRDQDGIGLVLHLGAKVQERPGHEAAVQAIGRQ